MGKTRNIRILDSRLMMEERERVFLAPNSEIRGHWFKRLLVRLCTIAITIGATTVLGFSAAFGGALAVYAVRFMTDTIIASPNNDYAPSDPDNGSFFVYYTMYYLFNGTVHPYNDNPYAS